MYQYLALTSLRDSHPLPTRHIRERGIDRRFFFTSLPYFRFRASAFPYFGFRFSVFHFPLHISYEILSPSVTFPFFLNFIPENDPVWPVWCLVSLYRWRLLLFQLQISITVILCSLFFKVLLFWPPKLKKGYVFVSKYKWCIGDVTVFQFHLARLEEILWASFQTLSGV